MNAILEKILLIGLYECFNGESNIFSPNDKQMQDQHERNLLQQVEEFPKYEIAFYNKKFFYKQTLMDHIFKQFL